MKRLHLETVTSTNDVAKHLLHQASGSMAAERVFAVTADVQTGGRGRNGKSWSGLAGENVYCSIALRHAGRTPSIQELVVLQAIGCLAAQAVCKELNRYTEDGRNVSGASALNISSDIDISPDISPDILLGSTGDAQRVHFRLKYPNDVYAVQQDVARKLCGTLVEHEFAGAHCVASVIGIGLNVRQRVFPAEIARKATSLLALGIDIHTEEVTQTMLRYAELFLKQRTEAVFAAWREELALEGASVQLAGETGWWRAMRLLDDGRLLLVHPTNGEERVISDGDSIIVDWMHAVSMVGGSA
jgi:BirA family biotin operon repressor/biotin-[acetyl-CoA-carboxylase] ligase